MSVPRVPVRVLQKEPGQRQQQALDSQGRAGGISSSRSKGEVQPALKGERTEDRNIAWPSDRQTASDRE